MTSGYFSCSINPIFRTNPFTSTHKGLRWRHPSKCARPAPDRTDLVLLGDSGLLRPNPLRDGTQKDGFRSLSSFTMSLFVSSKGILHILMLSDTQSMTLTWKGRAEKNGIRLFFPSSRLGANLAAGGQFKTRLVSWHNNS